MNNIRVKQESLNNWRKEFSINEEIEGGISVQNVADGLNFTEIETVDIIKPEPIKGSSDIEEGVGKVIKQVIKSPGVKKFVSNLSKKSKVKIVSQNPVITPGSTLGSRGKFAANHFDNVSTGAGSSYTPKHVKYLDNKVDKSKRGLTGHAGASGFSIPDSKSVKVYKQPSYINPKKYPGDKTGAYARELARQDNTARIGKNSSINKDGIGGNATYPDGRNTVGGKVKLKTLKGLEDENLEFLKKMKNESYNNWKLEMVTEILIAEGYTEEQILLEVDRNQGLGAFITGKALEYGLGGIKNTYNAGKFVRGVVNRGVRDAKLTKDVIDLGKKLRKPDGISVTNNPRNIKVPEKGGNMVKSFKGFLQNIKNRTGAKLDRINAKKAEIASTAKDVDVLGGAATNPATKIKPMKNITPSPIGDGIKKVTNQIKTGATAAAVTGGVVAGSKLTGGSPSKVAPAAPITNDGKKTVDPSKNEKIDTSPTKRELRNQRNDALSSKEGKRARRDARLQKKKDSGFPSKRMKSGTPVNQLFNKEEVTTEGLLSKIAKIGIGAFALKKSGEFLKKKGDEALDGARKNMKIGGDKRKSDIEKATGVKLDHYSWRDELGLIEGNRTKGFLGSGNKKDHSKGPNEKIYVDYTKIRANAPVKTDTKVG